MTRQKEFETSSTRMHIDTRQTLRGWRSNAVLGLAVLTCCAAFSASANAACGRPIPSNLPLLWPQPDLLNGAQLQEPASADRAQRPADSPSIVGLWHAKFMSSGQLYDEGFDAWHRDGTEILNDNGVPPAAGNVCLGVYTRTGTRSYKLKHVAWNWDTSGNLTGTLIIHEAVTVGTNGDSYHGSFVFDFYDLSGNLTSQVTGNLSATRIATD